MQQTRPPEPPTLTGAIHHPNPQEHYRQLLHPKSSSPLPVECFDIPGLLIVRNLSDFGGVLDGWVLVSVIWPVL